MFALLQTLGLVLAIIVLSAMTAAGAVAALMPWLRRIALAKPNLRSSHKEPTPQGGGLGFIAGTIGLGGLALALGQVPQTTHWQLLMGSMLGLGLLGLLDDHRPVPWQIKLLGQTAAALIASLGLPYPVVGTPAFVLLIAVATFVLVATVNFTNFVDGIDEISVAHAAPALLIPLGLAIMGALERDYGMMGAAALGALVGFWWWNRHPARVFLGDCGSLPLGLFLGWMALAVALAVHPALGLLIILYPLAEGGLTVLRRLGRGARLTQPHRDHAYQRAVDHGIPTRRVAGTVGLVGLFGSSLALLSYGLNSTEQPLGSDTALIAVLAGGLVMVAPIMVWLHKTRAQPVSR